MWKLDYAQTKYGFMKAIMKGKMVVLIVDILSDESINKLIEEHNHAIDKSYGKGLKDGVEIFKESRDK